MAFTVQVSYGAEKHKVSLAGVQSTVGELRGILEEATGVPPQAQKIIFKGRTLQDGSQTVGEIGMKEGSKLMLLGRKYSPEQEASLRSLMTLSREVDGVEGKIGGIREEVEGIEKGFLQAELIPEACRGLDKRCLACSEALMQKTEKLDAIDVPASETLVRSKRKSAVVRIQALLEKVDELAKRIKQCRTSR